ncbi:potassium voltage-gated channel subfamily S member 2-like [Stegostoma tigrinum]|uniref:potassium voltage-gated channel subfamily S member 2-like n=1 Tax=Stegostoma tigrinum TaxID=3053191 RepID=UPI0028700F15|nr:potassium voltage-gated channel subfamily S member 2-like [Stegostoma tigrinum]
MRAPSQDPGGMGEEAEPDVTTDAEIQVNVGGLKRRLRRGSLSRFPDTRLAQLLRCRSLDSILQLCDDYDGEEYYFDRNPALFPRIVDFYRTGELRTAGGKHCVFSLGQEIEYWGIGAGSLSRLTPGDRDEDGDGDGASDLGSSSSSLDEVLSFYRDAASYDGQKLGSCRRRLWLMLENPGYNAASRCYSAISILMVLSSITAMCVHSMAEFQRLSPHFEALEHFCIACFTLELLARLLVSPGVGHFFHRPLNLIDLMSILPFYLTLLAKLAMESSPALANLGRVVQVLRLMRIFRVLKLARHSTGLRSLGATLKHSYREVGLLLLYLSVGVSVFSVVAYTIEKEENSSLATIPSCWWWATVSMTTVGYGDVVPISIGGKLTASACILAGILVVVLPITLIFNKFSHFYRREKNLENAMRNCEFDERLAQLPLLNLRDYYADRMKSLMVSLNNMSRGSPSEHSVNSIH